MRDLRGLYAKTAALWIGCASLFHLYTAATGVLEPRLQRAIHLLFLLPGAFLYFPATKKSPKDRFTWLDATLAVLATAPCLLLIVEIERLNFRLEHVDDVLPREFIVGALGIILLIEGMRRAVVPAMAALGCLAIAYLLTSEYFPGILHYRDIELPEAVELLYLLSDEGMFGSITGISATFVALFVIFGAFVHVSGTGGFFTKLACKLAGRARGGPAKIAVVSSGFFGAISGVAAANVYTTGTFSIPLMKKLGYRRQFAGAVEAAASTGGMILPPVMGAGAFVMAEITGIPYVTICFAAVIGAVMYFLSIGIMVHLEAAKYDLKSMAEDELPSVKEIIKDAYLLIPLVGLVGFLIIGYSPFMAAFVSILLSVAVMLGELLVREAAYVYRARTGAGQPSGETTIARHLMKELYGLGLKITDALVLGGRNMIMVALACAGAGFVVSVITNTGLGLSFSSVIIAYSNGIAILALMFVMVASIILGMGLPCTPAYIIAASVGAPALLKMGGDLLAAHLFVYYFAILASVTPPVCITAYAGAALAGANPLRTGFEAFALALGGFVVPYVFYFDPALLMQGDFLAISSSVLRLFFMIVMLAIALQGWWLKKIPMAVRGGLIALSVSLPVVFSTKAQGILIGFAVLALLYVFQSRQLAQEQEGFGRQ